MQILQELLGEISVKDFLIRTCFRSPLAKPDTARRFEGFLSWDLLDEIFISGHRDCWLPRHGQLPDVATGRLSPGEARQGLQEKRTLLIRHAEQAHPAVKAIADDFRRLFQCPIDIQIYVTPAGEEGFDWHYDVEDVFVIQTSGEKEFYLKSNTVTPRPLPMMSAEAQFHSEPKAPTTACLLRAGDWLYIPAGYWHKARAVTDSFHISIGVMYQPAAPTYKREAPRDDHARPF